MAYAFCCRSCGHLVAAEAAGELTHPLACPVCKAGVRFRHQDLADELAAPNLSPQQRDSLVAQIKTCQPHQKRHVKDDWEVLADATPERLKELGLEPGDVERHVPFHTRDADGKRRPLDSSLPPTEPKHVAVTLSDRPGSSDQAAA